MFWWSINAPSSVLALVTTVHAALTVLRLHRSAGVGRAPLLILPSVALAAFPWVFSTVAVLASGLVLHLAWFVACEKLANPATAGRAQPLSAPPPAAAGPRSGGRSLRPKEFVPVTVLAVHDESDTIRTFRMSRPEYFSFVAGQFLTVRVAVDGTPYVRCYSVSSAPASSGYMEISVRRQGVVSTALHDSCTVGSVLLVKPPAGKFTYPHGDERPMVLLAGGVGITPLISMMRHAVSAEPWRTVTLLFSVRSEKDIAFRDELAVLARRHPQVRVVVVLSAPVPGTRFRTGHIDEPLVREQAPSPADSLFYVCGPPPMIDAMRAMLAAMGVPKSQVRSEEFQPTAAIGARAAAPALAGAGAVAAVAGNTKLVLTLSNRIADVPPGTTLLEAAEAAGVTIPSLCRSGVCGTCKTRLLSGDVHCTSEALDADDRAEHYTLPCVAWSAGDCALEA